jgi:protein SCO1
MRSRVALLLLVTALAAGCGEREPGPRFQLTDVTGAPFGRTFELTDHHGKRRTLEDFRSRVVVMFFGFVHCPDICPMTLQELALVARELGPDAARLQVLFVTVDPERDTPELLRQYVPAFHPGFLGLHGTLEETARAAREFKVYFQKQPLPNGGYTVDHSAGLFILDGHGRLRLFAPHGVGAKTLLHDIQLLMKEHPGVAS